MTVRIGTLADRISNRFVRAFPGPLTRIDPARPIVSFSFDDAPVSSWRVGAPMLEDAGWRATFYLAGGLVVSGEPELDIMPAEGCADLAARGHELGCHTYAHPKLSTLSKAALGADLDRNGRFLKDFDGRAARRNFAVPYTMVSPFKQPMLRARYRTSRGGRPGINRGPTDLHCLSSVELHRDFFDLDRFNGYFDDLARAPGWLIFFTHYIDDEPWGGFGVSPRQFGAVIEEVARRGFDVLTVDAALDRMGIAA